MPHENAAEYKQYLDRRFKKFLPVGDDETITVQSIVDNEWRLARIAPLEEGVFTLGHRLFADEFADEENPATRAALIRVKTMQEYRRDLSISLYKNAASAITLKRTSLNSKNFKRIAS